MAQEAPGQTLQATALVQEAYVRLVNGHEAQHWDGRRHFFASSAEVMRRILVDQARRRQALKRGGQAEREDLHGSAIVATEPKADVLGVNDALEGLDASDPVAAKLVRLRFFAGLNMAEAALALDMSVRSAQGICCLRPGLAQLIPEEAAPLTNLRRRFDQLDEAIAQWLADHGLAAWNLTHTL